MKLHVLIFSIAIAGSSSFMSTVHASPRDQNGTIEVGQGNLRLVYAVKEGKLTRYFNSRSMVSNVICTCKFSWFSYQFSFFFSLEHFDVFLLPQIVCEKDYDVGFWMKISNKWFLILFPLLYKFRCILVIKPHIYESHGPVVILWSCWPWFCLLRFLNYFSIIFFLPFSIKSKHPPFFTHWSKPYNLVVFIKLHIESFYKRSWKIWSNGPPSSTTQKEWDAALIDSTDKWWSPAKHDNRFFQIIIFGDQGIILFVTNWGRGWGWKRLRKC